MISTFAGYKLFSKRHIPPQPRKYHPIPDNLSFQFAETILRIIWHQKIKKPLPFARSPVLRHQPVQKGQCDDIIIRYHIHIQDFEDFGSTPDNVCLGKKQIKKIKKNQKGNGKSYF